MVTENEQWPSLPYDEWKDTYATLHMWTQIVGKIALAQAPPLNHSWSVTLLVTPRGLTTRTLPHGGRTFTMEFDFIDHQLVIRTSDGDVESVALAPRSVADFYADVMATLTAMALPVKIWPMAVEIPVPIRLDTDEAHHSYDAGAREPLLDDPVEGRARVRRLRAATSSASAARCISSGAGSISPSRVFPGARRRRATARRSCARPTRTK